MFKKAKENIKQQELEKELSKSILESFSSLKQQSIIKSTSAVNFGHVDLQNLLGNFKDKKLNDSDSSSMQQSQLKKRSSIFMKKKKKEPSLHCDHFMKNAYAHPVE